MHAPKISFLSTLAALALLGVAHGAEGLSGSAASLASALGTLQTTLGQRSIGSKVSGSTAKEIDHARQAAATLSQRAAAGDDREAVGMALNDVRGGIESMRAGVVHSNPSSEERSALHRVDSTYGEVVRHWDSYHGGGGRPHYVTEAPEHPVAASAPAAPAHAAAPAGGGRHISDSAAKSTALSYLAARYHVSERSIQVQDVLDLGSRRRVVATAAGHLRAVDVDGRSGTIFADMLVN